MKRDSFIFCILIPWYDFPLNWLQTDRGTQVQSIISPTAFFVSTCPWVEITIPTESKTSDNFIKRCLMLFIFHILPVELGLTKNEFEMMIQRNLQ